MANERTFVLERLETEDNPLADEYSINQAISMRSYCPDGEMNMRFHPQLDETTHVRITGVVYRAKDSDDRVSVDWASFLKLNNPKEIRR